MYRKEAWVKAFLLSGIFLFLLGCQGTKIIVERGPSQEPSPTYKKGGPPPWAPAHGYRAKHNYRYYPSSRVYHDRERGVYFYYRDGRWGASASLPAGIRIDFDDYVTLAMNTGKPYEWDHEVIKKYPPGQMKKKNKHKNKWK
ncbi:MAG: hypothetical protein JRJ85_17895 [Deltaproteobacteria bacterium]|nr:hypothetical protein [Deltaproteobacteria bacterium]